MKDDDNLVNIITMPVYQDIHKATHQTVFSIAPEEKFSESDTNNLTP